MVETVRADDIGPSGAGEYARLRARIDELESQKRLLELKVVALESEIAELKEAGALNPGKGIAHQPAKETSKEISDVRPS
jgi:hypothetical protein